jgi:hypothetical protein
MAITRAQLLQEIMPGLNALFDIEYAKHNQELFGIELNMDDYTVEVDFDEKS